ncbi:hypothetical protein HRR83_000224 [Exophiala dermatitidis]|uniref:Cholestenol delta-isomerase n=2 Tax=Exophiala dermatitidis TaxID=5970 RepID=H6C8N8_EXODN|nr:cholestenol delta-isomerase [Exophiala dermatitidis NIH/UT8656]KAJ4523577.1 hypothetical protein HRR73_002760 [Exophiala dermatitidis]EHY60465.1 cholestenol delta-isomerase [Exophiala dermatitidis NIH/UT8656]KAJ4527471.1 hypothetical protein HRR74_000225 [Exophiala dermatitidis]KAJ4531040.1 hypothetical protein HRR76_008722 [Exophiala dermatitidis]KAJ4558207.1 hypothetical protein HRR77_000223 [Exophiala dermatitidis]
MKPSSAAAASMPDMEALHPYFPIEAEIVNFIANDMTLFQLLAAFGTGCVGILSVGWLIASSAGPKLRKQDKFMVLWFCLTGVIHLFFEGYFAYNHTRMGSARDLFGQLWKEYALSDSRYLTSDPFVLCMETITALFWGPLSFLMVYFIVTAHPLRYPVQAVVSLGQIYGDVLYYATCMFDHYYKSLTYCRPEAYYFWFYFFFMNFIWIVIPGLLLADSIITTAKAFKALNRISHSVQGNGSVNKPSVNGRPKRA